MAISKKDIDYKPWAGPVRKYDIVKEGTVAIMIVTLLVATLSLLFGSPDEPALTFKGWAQTNPDNFVATSVAELAGTSESAGYGAPYNYASEGLHMGPLYLQKWAGVTQAVDSVNDLVITPLTTYATSTDVVTALTEWNSASAEQKVSWATSYDTAVNDVEQIIAEVPSGDYGPVPVLVNGLLDMAKSGSLDSALTAGGNFYSVNNTKQILFIGDGAYLDDTATQLQLQGDSWGMMNEPNRYPGQAWLWLYSFWYQVPPFVDESQEPFGANADVYIMALMGILSFGLILIPVIPGVRNLPHRIPIHRLIWKDYYKKHNILRK